MNIALIFAGGTGQRMNSKKLPKQFLELYNKPIIIYTIEQFEAHPEIDGIVVVCLDGWHDYLKKMLHKFDITKVSAIVSGGKTGQDSIFNGLAKINELYPSDSIILVHDGVRPLIDDELISDNIESVKKYGSAITVSPSIETVTVVENENNMVCDIIERKNCRMAKAPQSFIFKDLFDAHMRAQEINKHDFIDSASIMTYYGYKIYTVEGSPSNIKITTPTDYYVFKALVDVRNNEHIMGI